MVIMEKDVQIYRDLDTLRSPTLPASVYFVLNSQTQKVFQIWVTNNQNVPKQVELNSTQLTGNISQFINDVGYLTSASLPSGESLLRQEFTYAGGVQIFTLLNNYSQVYSVEVQGQGALSESQYSLITPNQVQISDTLGIGDYVVILYGQTSIGISPYYTQAQTDALLGKNRIFNEVPLGAVNGINATFTTQFNFVPETLSVFLNGSLQKIINDYQSVGNNTILLNTSPFTGENILINYTKL